MIRSATAIAARHTASRGDVAVRACGLGMGMIMTTTTTTTTTTMPMAGTG